MNILNLWRRLVGRVVRKGFTLTEDNEFYTTDRPASREDRDRHDYDREEVLRLALEAWRVNPLARRIVGLTTQYVVGAGLEVRSDHQDTHNFLKEWWNHRLNQLTMRVYEWCDELSRSGELFLLLSTDAAGMTYVRAVPASEIETIITAANDLQQEYSYVQAAIEPGNDPVVWPAYNEGQDAQGSDGSFSAVMLHYAVNRPVGAVRGESDLAPMLRWLSRYSNWLEDRARLNRYRNTFLFVVKARFNSEEERYQRQTMLTTTPPTPGSILVVDESEEWSVLNPQLESQEAGEDGLALKKMIAAGAGLPLHFLAEPESSNKSTAEAAGGPTYRHFEQRQEFFLWLVGDLARVVCNRRALAGGRINLKAEIQVQGADLSARDNAALGVAASTIVEAMLDLRRAGLVDNAEVLRMFYRFAGEVADVEKLIADAKKAGPLVEQPSMTRSRAKRRGAVTEGGDVKKLPKVE